MPHKTKKTKNSSKSHPKERMMVYKEEKEEARTFYGQVNGKLGFCRFNVISFEDNETRNCILKKSIKKSARIEIGTVVLFGQILNLYEIVYIYSDSEVKRLQKEDKIPSNLNKNEFESDEDEDFVIDFDEI